MNPARLREIKERDLNEMDEWDAVERILPEVRKDIPDLAACVEQLVGALREIVAEGHTEGCALMMQYGRSCRCHVATAQSALKGWEE